MPMSASFSISSATTACEGFEFAGSVRDGGEGVLLPWIAALSNKLSGVPTVQEAAVPADRKSTRLNSSHSQISYAVFCLKKNTFPLERHHAVRPEHGTLVPA